MTTNMHTREQQLELLLSLKLKAFSVTRPIWRKQPKYPNLMQQESCRHTRGWLYKHTISNQYTKMCACTPDATGVASCANVQMPLAALRFRSKSIRVHVIVGRISFFSIMNFT